MTTYLAKCFGVTLGFVLLLSGQSAALEADEERNGFLDTELSRLIHCDVRPFALGVVLYLHRAGRIDYQKREWESADGETCWRVTPSLSFRGEDFFAICVATNDPELIRLFPNLYWRAPGSGSPDRITLVSRRSPSELSDWARKNLPMGNYYVDSNTSTATPDSSELICSRL